MRITLHYEHEPIKDECQASQSFEVTVTESRNGYYVPPILRCIWCDVEPRLDGKMVVSGEGPHSRACGWRVHAHGYECSKNCPTCGGKNLDPSHQAAPHAETEMRSKPVSRIDESRIGPHNGESKIEEYRNVRAGLEWGANGERVKIPTQDGTPLSRKMFIETLCVAQSRIGNSPHDQMRRRPEHIARLQILIDVLKWESR